MKIFKKFIPLWKALNIVLVYASHKTINVDIINGIIIKPCPLFAVNIDIAKQLLTALQNDISGESVLLDVPENNNDAVHLAKSLGMTVVFATARMYQKGLPDICNEKIFGITTFELG